MSKRKKHPAGHAPRKHKKKTHHTLHGFGYTATAEPPTLKQTAIETGKDLLVGVIGGGLAGAALGKSSLLAGILITGAGHHMRNRYVQLLGIGMMASNGFQKSGTTNGLDGIDGVKDRLMAYKDSFSQKFYLDRFLKPKPLMPPSAAGIGEVQYFTYPEAINGDLAALSDIENQLTQSALQFQGTTGEYPEMTGDLPEIAGDLPEAAVGDVEDRLY